MTAELSQLPGDASRVQHVASLLMQLPLFASNHSVTSSLEMAAQSFYKKLIIADEYVVDGTFTGSVTLIRARQGHVEADGLGDDYGLAQVSGMPGT